MSKKKTDHHAGRPAGMPNSEHLVVAVIPAACPSCRSTERESIRIVIEREAAGTMPSGQPRTHIVWRRVRCKNCGQYYIEQEHRNRVAEKTIGNPDSFTPKNVDAPPPDA